MAEIKRIVDYCFGKGVTVLLDPHNFGQIYDSRLTGNSIYPNTSKYRVIANDAEAQNLFADFWTRIATKFKNYPNVIFNLINEPHDVTAANWKTGAVKAINAIAAVTTAQPVAIPGTNYTGAHD